MKISLIDSQGQPVVVSTSAILAFAFLGCFAAVTLGAYLAGQWDLFKTLSQGLENIIIAIAAYYWGSSSSSRAKDDAIASAIKPPANGDTPS